MSQRASSSAIRGEAQRATDGTGVRCRQCGAEQPPAPLCSACQALLPLPPDADHYQVFGFPRRLAIDRAELSRRYYELSRLLHPDRHSAGSAEARETSMQNTAALTRAYRALRDPVARALYWLEMHGEKLGDDNKVPPQLAALVFEVQERLEELRAAKAVETGELATEVRAELAGLRAQSSGLDAKLEENFRQWDGDGADQCALLADLKSILARRAYLATLIRDVEAALGGTREDPS